MSSMYDPESLTEMLPFYYKRIFPYGPYLRWLFYGNLDNFRKREFSFTLNHDIYARYISYNSPSELKKDLIKRCPQKIDLGAIYDVCPKDHLQHSVFTPRMRELVFDIDMTDYDDVRYCCSGADICAKCWRYMIIACKILDTALREDFDFQLLLWVFSGRRGIHCWVCDPAALDLDGRGRSALAEYLSVLTANPVKKVYLGAGDTLHPHLKRARIIIEDQFPKILEEQELLSTKERQSKVLNLVSNGEIRNEIEKEWNRMEQQGGDDVSKWDKLVAIIRHHQAKSSDRKLRFAVDEILLELVYPRLDIHVTKGVNHLLKSPFCVHPKTGKVCVPFQPRAVERFNPAKVPTINQLIAEVELYDEKHNLLNKTVDETSTPTATTNEKTASAATNNETPMDTTTEEPSQATNGEIQATKSETEATKSETQPVKQTEPAVATPIAKQLRNEYKKTCLVKSIAVFEEFLKAFHGVWKGELAGGVSTSGADPMTF
uniref:DNA primase n=1 Tax=Cacopsylla melanoneura TaxID=428564 RepID=A0A8D8YPY7_9HEMI